MVGVLVDTTVAVLGVELADPQLLGRVIISCNKTQR